MIVEMRTYVLEPGRQAAFLALMGQEGLPIERPVLGRLLGFYTTEIGPLNQVVHLWGYDSFEERQRRRQQLASDPRWVAFLPRVLPMIRTMNNQLMQPAPFAEIHTLDWHAPAVPPA